MASVWEFFFKYPLVVFEKGRLLWAPPVPQGWILGVGALVLAAVAWSYLRARGRLETRDRAVLLALRASVVVLVVLCLMRPTLLVPTAVPQENYLAVVIDDSRSMRIADREGEPRSAFVQRTFGAQESALIEELGRRFRLRFFRFSEDAQRVGGVEEMRFAGGRSYLGRALERARADLASVPLAGIVMVSDGADNSAEALSESLLALRAASIPVFTVGVGREAYERDIEVSRVAAPRSVLRGSTLLVDVTLAQTGYSGQTVQLVVEDAGRIVDTQEVTLPRDGTPAVLRARFRAEEDGPRRYRFRIQPLEGERVLENNQRDVLIEVRGRREKILYFEGEPRFEVKFLRRAVADDPQLQVVVLQRTAENKFLRLDVDNAQELEAGFPTTREELFAYRGLILGSVEASNFTNEQLRMIAEFVGERGGGLLMLGGRRSFAEGGWAGTPVAPLLPVELDPSRERDTTFFAELRVQPTRAGLAHAVTQVAETPEQSATRWASLPALSTYNRIGTLKPGATALLTGQGTGAGAQVVLAHQRYGAGQALALAVQDSWIWQMHAEIPLEDQTHERFWRQMLRWLVSDVPGPVRVSTGARQPAPGEAVELVADVRDAAYRRVNDARVTARVESPTGEPQEVPLSWSVNQDGEFRGSFTPGESGAYRVVVQATRGESVLSADTQFVQVAAGDEEFFAAQLRTPLLRRIAEETGGRFYTQGNLGSLPADLSHSGRGVTVAEEREIWDMPLILFLVVGLVASEWGYRRRRGLP